MVLFHNYFGEGDFRNISWGQKPCNVTMKLQRLHRRTNWLVYFKRPRAEVTHWFGSAGLSGQNLELTVPFYSSSNP